MEVKILSLCFLLMVVSGSFKYTAFLDIPNPREFEKMVFATSNTLAVFYGPASKISTAFKAYSWSKIMDSSVTDFLEAPITMEYFTDVDNNQAFLYGADAG